MFAKESVSEISPRRNTIYLRLVQVTRDHELPRCVKTRRVTFLLKPEVPLFKNCPCHIHIELLSFLKASKTIVNQLEEGRQHKTCLYIEGVDCHIHHVLWDHAVVAGHHLFDHLSYADSAHLKTESMTDCMFSDVFGGYKVIGGCEPALARIHNVG